MFIHCGWVQEECLETNWEDIAVTVSVKTIKEAFICRWFIEFGSGAGTCDGWAMDFIREGGRVMEGDDAGSVLWSGGVYGEE